MVDAGLTPQQIADLSAIDPPSRSRSGPATDGAGQAVGFVVGIALDLAMIFTGQSLAMNVGMEKFTRIAEVLLAVLRPSQILVGNVIGIGIQTLIQRLALAVPILVVIADGGLNCPRWPPPTSPWGSRGSSSGTSSTRSCSRRLRPWWTRSPRWGPRSCP